MLDMLLNIGSAFDWITPALAFVQDCFGPIADFQIPASPYWGRKQIRQLLRTYGVHAWGLMYNFSGDVLMFTVDREQSQLTFDILQSAGIPILYAPPDLDSPLQEAWIDNNINADESIMYDPENLTLDF